MYVGHFTTVGCLQPSLTPFPGYCYLADKLFQFVSSVFHMWPRVHGAHFPFI